MTINNMRRVLVVDDEPQIVSAVKRELRLPPDDVYTYEVEGFSDPRAALARCNEIPFAAVISDYRMPEMDGVEFIKRLTEILPDCARIILSGQTDMPALVRMVNELNVSHFIAKPWNPYFLKAALGQAIDYNEIIVRHRELSAQAKKLKLEPAAQDVPPALVLIVDDDQGVLQALARTLRSLGDVDITQNPPAPASFGRVEIVTATSAEDAMRLLDEKAFSCIIADQNMPGMSGLNLLRWCAQKQPQCLRLLISGGMAQGDLIQAVNQTHIFAFLEKPWNDGELKKTVYLAVQRRRMLAENQQLARLLEKAPVSPASTFHEFDPDDDQIKRG